MAKRSLGGAIARRAIERIEEAAQAQGERGASVAGYELVPEERVQLLESAYQDYRVLQREVELVGYGLFDYANRMPNELRTQQRRRIVRGRASSG
jgi:hypothetical protein